MTNYTIHSLPKAELHVHLEGTITPKKLRELSNKNNIPIPQDLFSNDGQYYHWTDNGTASNALLGFLQAYDAASHVIKHAEDYTEITYDYLIRSASQGVIYTELTISADHGRAIDLPYPDMVKAIARGADQAKQKTGIETRLISTCVRHYGIEQALNVAQTTVDHPHPLVTGFTMAGDENAHHVADFKPAFDLARSAGLNVTAHAGEAAGSQSIKDVRDIIGCKRFGHMVRIIEDPVLMDEMLKYGAVPEICVSSNLALKLFNNYSDHPLRQLWDAGFPVTLNSDDPPFFSTNIGREYKIAHKCFNFTLDDLLQMTINAINAAFIDDATRQTLLQKIQ
jgi:adenosine deaminase